MVAGGSYKPLIFFTSTYHRCLEVIISPRRYTWNLSQNFQVQVVAGLGHKHLSSVDLSNEQVGYLYQQLAYTCIHIAFVLVVATNESGVIWRENLSLKWNVCKPAVSICKKIKHKQHGGMKIVRVLLRNTCWL